MEYCVRKDGEKLSASHVLNKAAKLVREHKYTYEQVEADLADFNTREKELSKLFALLNIYKKPQDADYAFLEKWTNLGMEQGAVTACAEALGKGSLSTLDALIEEVSGKGYLSEHDVREYLARRKTLTDVVYKVARKLGVKIANPRAYCEEYAEKWLERGYDEESLTLLAAYAMKLSYGFPELDNLLDTLYAAGIVDEAGVKAYCAARDKQLRLLQRIQTVCGVVRKTQTALDMIETWRSWQFSDEMILEAAKRSASAASPLPYMNKLLSEWKFPICSWSPSPSPLRRSPKKPALRPRPSSSRNISRRQRSPQTRAPSASATMPLFAGAPSQRRNRRSPRRRKTSSSPRQSAPSKRARSNLRRRSCLRPRRCPIFAPSCRRRAARAARQ